MTQCSPFRSMETSASGREAARPRGEARTGSAAFRAEKKRRDKAILKKCRRGPIATVQALAERVEKDVGVLKHDPGLNGSSKS